MKLHLFGHYYLKELMLFLSIWNILLRPRTPSIHMVPQKGDRGCILGSYVQDQENGDLKST